MKRPGIGTIISLFANILLSAWLVNQYLYDQYFHGYVDTALSPLLPYLVLTIGIGGGSSLGYILLRRKPSGAGISAKLQKSKLPKQSGPLPGQPGSSLQTKNVPVGAPPGPVSKQTAYAVPPLSKSPSPAPQRAPSASLASAPKQSGPSLVAEQRVELKTVPFEALKQTFSGPSLSARADSPAGQVSPQPSTQPARLEPFDRPRNEPAPQSLPSTFSGFGDELKRTPPINRPTEPTTPQYQGLFQDNSSRPGNFPGQASGQGTDRTSQPPPLFQPSKWQPPDTGTKPVQWNDPVPRQGYSPSQKWAPPPVSPVSNPRPPSPMTPQGRPGQPPQGRPLFPGSQGPPRPLAFPGTLRPTSSGVPGPFRPEPRPGPGLGQQRPEAPGQKPAPPLSPGLAGERKEPASSATPQPGPTQSSPQKPTQAEPPTRPIEADSSVPPSSGEMDWDTALDTILKTLRKDKVGDKP